MENSPLINMSWRVPKSMEQEMDDFFDDWQQFMRRTHTMLNPRLAGAASLADDLIGPRLNEFYISKGPFLPSPLETLTSGSSIFPRSADDLLYTRADSYADLAGVNRHLQLLNDVWPQGMERMLEYNRDYGVNANVGNLKVISSLEDRVGDVKIEKGHPVVNMTWKVPKSKEEEMDAFWESHEKWMRSSHAKSFDRTSDSKVPRLINYWVAKGPELVDPFDSSKGETGNVIYTESETYQDDDGIDKHVALAKESWKEGWEKLLNYNRDYAVLTNVGGGTKVITSRF